MLKEQRRVDVAMVSGPEILRRLHNYVGSEVLKEPLESFLQNTTDKVRANFMRYVTSRLALSADEIININVDNSGQILPHTRSNESKFKKPIKPCT